MLAARPNRGHEPGGLLARIDTAETVLVILTPFAAAAMARGLWLFA